MDSREVIATRGSNDQLASQADTEAFSEPTALQSGFSDPAWEHHDVSPLESNYEVSPVTGLIEPGTPPFPFSRPASSTRLETNLLQVDVQLNWNRVL